MKKKVVAYQWKNFRSKMCKEHAVVLIKDSNHRSPPPPQRPSKSSTGHMISRGLLDSDKDQSCFIKEKGDMIFNSNYTKKCRTNYIRELKQRQRRRQRERHKSNRFRSIKKMTWHVHHVNFFCTFLCRHCTTTT